MSTILLLLNLVALGCALMIIWRAYQDSVMWALFFLLTPLVYYALTRFTGPIIAGVIVIGLQLYYVTRNWKAVGKPFTVLVIAWLAGQLLPTLMNHP